MLALDLEWVPDQVLARDREWEMDPESELGLDLALDSVLGLSVLDPGQAGRPHRRRDQSCSSGHGRRQAAAAQRLGAPSC